MKKPQAFSRCGSPGSKLFGFEIPRRQPGTSRLLQVAKPVESKMLFRARNRTRVSELKHHAERVWHLTINRWALPDTGSAGSYAPRAGGY